jgi:hypothetical protein
LAILAAFAPTEASEKAKDALAELGMTEDDLRELVRKNESPARDDQ